MSHLKKAATSIISLYLKLVIPQTVLAHHRAHMHAHTHPPVSSGVCLKDSQRHPCWEPAAAVACLSLAGHALDLSVALMLGPWILHKEAADELSQQPLNPNLTCWTQSQIPQLVQASEPQAATHGVHCCSQTLNTRAEWFREKIINQTTSAQVGLIKQTLGQLN